METGELKGFIASAKLGAVFEAFPYAADFFSCVRLERIDQGLPLTRFLETVPELYLEDFGFSRSELALDFIAFIGTAEANGGRGRLSVSEVSVIGGIDKSGERESVGFSVAAGEIVAVVGVTGSGKSRLLADIECLAQGDTPTRRSVLVDGRIPDNGFRFDTARRLVAQLSQNMNFVMDLAVGDFLEMHAQARASRDPGWAAREIHERANELAGERFGLDTKVTQLSGGQSRALMIADVAFLSDSPVVVIDELENAGIDRRRALALLAKKDKIVIMSTHDPLLALMADRRIVIRNGGIASVTDTAKAERESLGFIEGIDARMAALRGIIRSGGTVDFDMRAFFKTRADS
jgi:ABC-type lipoprotein export system ATPase subunit